MSGTQKERPRARRLRPVDLGRAIGLSAQMARRYERWGILPPAERSAAGHRQFDERHHHAILALRAMQAGYGWRAGNQILRRVQQGDLAGALEMVDCCHAALHERRRQIEQTLEMLRVVQTVDQASPDSSALPGPSAPAARAHTRRRGEVLLRVGEAARQAGVRVSSVHFWEAQGLLQPTRDRESNYRVFDRRQVARLRVVKVLRDAGYNFPAIRATLDELGAGRPDPALSAIERRREELTRASERCSRATAALWSYVAETFGKSHALSGSLPNEAAATSAALGSAP